MWSISHQTVLEGLQVYPIIAPCVHYSISRPISISFHNLTGLLYTSPQHCIEGSCYASLARFHKIRAHLSLLFLASAHVFVVETIVSDVYRIRSIWRCRMSFQSKNAVPSVNIRTFLMVNSQYIPTSGQFLFLPLHWIRPMNNEFISQNTAWNVHSVHSIPIQPIP